MTRNRTVSGSTRTIQRKVCPFGVQFLEADDNVYSSCISRARLPNVRADHLGRRAKFFARRDVQRGREEVVLQLSARLQACLTLNRRSQRLGSDGWTVISLDRAFRLAP